MERKITCLQYNGVTIEILTANYHIHSIMPILFGDDAF